MRFLLPRDYNAQLRHSVKQAISRSNDYTIEDAEDAAIEQASGYLRSRYDVSKVFAPIPAHDADTQYNEGEYVYDPVDARNTIYMALVDNPSADLKNTNDWKPKDPRNRHLITIIIDLSAYLLFTATGLPMSQLREKRYDDAIQWLVNVQKELVSPDLPLMDEDKPSGAYIMGANKKLRDKW